MNFDIKLQMKMQQKLIMTPNLQLAIKLLQLTKLELKDVLQQNMLENPVLEIVPETETDEYAAKEAAEKEATPDYESSGKQDLDEIYPDKIPETKEKEPLKWEEIDEYLREEYDYGYMPREQKDAVIFENMTSNSKSLFDILYEQLILETLDDSQMKIGLEIIGNIDENGYLSNPIEEIASSNEVSVEAVKFVLSKIQNFEPSGIAARDLKECMLIQIQQRYPDEKTAYTIVSDYLCEVEKGNFQGISDEMNLPLSEINRAMEVIMGLEPKPGRKYSNEEIRYIIPDVIITKIDNDFIIMLSNEGIPRLRISNLYLSILKNKKKFSNETREYIEKKLNSAKWLLRSIEQRQQTLYKVSNSILKFQKPFFEKGIGYIKPLVLRDVAEDISMHESTVSRVCTNKYMHTPRGVFELKYFFHSGLSSTFGEDISSLRIKDIIKKLVKQEEPVKPLSDKAIAKILLQQGIKIARRTVAKYREELKISSSSKRRKR